MLIFVKSQHRRYYLTMARQTEFIQLSKEERSYLKTLFSGGNSSNRKQNRARILDLLAKRTSPPEIARLLGCSLMTVRHIKRRYLAESIESALSEKPRSGKPVSGKNILKFSLVSL